MAKVKAANSSTVSVKTRPALSPEAEENECIALAYDLVKQRLSDGTASSQETTHFLKQATAKAKYELELVKAQTAMAIAKKEVLESQKRSEAKFEEAIKAFKMYSGHGGEEETYDDY